MSPFQFKGLKNKSEEKIIFFIYIFFITFYFKYDIKKEIII